jgi:hypothetical protein
MTQIEKAQEAYLKRIKARCFNKKFGIHIYVHPDVKKARTLELIGDVYICKSISDAAVKKFRQKAHK